MINNLKSHVRRMAARTSTTWRALIAVAVAGMLTAACDVHGVTAPGSLAKIVVTPNATVSALASQQMVAVGYDAEDRVIPINPTWSIAASGGTVNAGSGIFAAGATPGVFASTVVATVGTIKGSATITVVAGPLASITVTPTPATVGVQGTQQFTAVGRDASGNVVPFIPTWSLVAGGGTLDQSGLFTAGIVAGTYTNTVQASNNNLKGLATVTVTPGALASITVSPSTATMTIGTTQLYTAVGKDANGNTVVITPTWSVAAGGGSVASSGIFTAGTVPGVYAGTVKATSGTISGTAGATVTSGALASITVTPNPAAVAIGGAQQFTANGFDASGNSVAVTPTWSVVAGGGTITAVGGLFTAGTVPGTYTNTVTATSGTISGRATVVVGTGSLATITVTPNPDTLAINGTRTYSAVGRDIAGNVVVITPTWTVANGGGVITSTGLFTAGTVPGAYINTITATSGTVTGRSTVVVTPGPLATVSVTPNPASVAINGAQQFTATGRDVAGNVVAITPVWTANATAGTVNAAGLFTAGTTPGAYPTGVTATVGTLSGSAVINVSNGQLATITVTPNPGTLIVGGTLGFTAVGRDLAGNVVTIVPVWTAATGGTINAGTGVFTAGNTPGTYINSVKAAVGTVNGTSTVTVTAGPLATITVTPNPANMNTGATMQFTAVGKDAAGNVVTITPTWSANATAGTVTLTGLFTAGSTAGTYNNGVTATSGTISGSAQIVETAVVNVVNRLGRMAVNGIFAATQVTCVTGAVINADVAISAGSTIVGPCTISGTQNLGNATAANQKLDLISAHDSLAALPCSAANTVGTTNLGGTTKAAGVWCSASSLGVTGTLTLDGGGDENATFVFQAGSALTTAGNIVLINGAKANNVFWVLGSDATLGTLSHFQGNILALNAITINDNATLIGRALARNAAVTLGTNGFITLP